ncbi:hypothetical protein M422DRAFT_245108 [Sphaerobolus stellatus SS14]|nr:hypothetical protein M422DRAFT_245108 [Sphaerobolus stellatus SS14]
MAPVPAAQLPVRSHPATQEEQPEPVFKKKKIAHKSAIEAPASPALTPCNPNTTAPSRPHTSTSRIRASQVHATPTPPPRPQQQQCAPPQACESTPSECGDSDDSAYKPSEESPGPQLEDRQDPATQELSVAIQQEEWDQPSKRNKKKKKNLNNPVIRMNAIQTKWGCSLGRIIDAFSNPKFIISVGIQLENKIADGEDVSGYPEKQLRLSNTYTLFIEHLVEIDTYLTKVSNEPDKNIQQTDLYMFYEYLTAGQDGARNDDTGIIKSEVLEMLRVEFQAEAVGLTKNKSSHGFTHPLTRRLLIPSAC